MPVFNDFRGTTALVALFALAAPNAMAQDNSNTGSDAPAASESSQMTGSDLTDLVDDAEAPATDGTNQTQGAGTTGSSQGNTPGDTNVAPGDMNIQGSMTNQNAGQTVMLDIEGFAQQIYERGFRQGYVSGVSDTRQQVMEQVRAQRMQQMQQMQNSGSTSPAGQTDSGNQMSNDMASGSDQGQSSAPAPGGDPISSDVAARPGGSIIVLPPGVSPEAFLDQIMRQNQQ